jgi:hypothetical protein
MNYYLHCEIQVFKILANLASKGVLFSNGGNEIVHEMEIREWIVLQLAHCMFMRQAGRGGRHDGAR